MFCKGTPFDFMIFGIFRGKRCGYWLHFYVKIRIHKSVNLDLFTYLYELRPTSCLID